KAAEKEAAMRDFVEGKTKILISTTVIEVGVNVPAASLMVIENAERFGLSQLHQLRGRVGRGTRKSYCILVSNAKGTTAKERLETMHTTYDGYLIAEADLKQRGPGDFFAAEGESFRQSGLPAFRFAALSDDGVMEAAFAHARLLLDRDPALSLPEHLALKEKVGDLLIKNKGTVS
ncbi:MAG: ATP-dependent DNA helicase RecG, partial [Clostridia bacterium]|nr:ATP-dependent DNA helicase RecG [Clostridia bacterium]